MRNKILIKYIRRCILGPSLKRCLDVKVVIDL